MKYCAAIMGLFSVLIVGCDNNTQKEMPSASNTLPPVFITDKSVWEGNFEQCYDQQSVQQCLIDTIKKTGTQDAVKAAQYLADKEDAGYISAYNKAGIIGVAEVVYPFRANNNLGTLLVPTKGQPVDVDQIPSDLDQFPAWKAFVKKNPDVAVWAPATLSEKEQTQQGQAFIFAYSIKTCHACAQLGSLYVRYSFNQDGEFVNHQLIDIKEY